MDTHTINALARIQNTTNLRDAALILKVYADGLTEGKSGERNRISVIKAIRQITGWGLVESKQFCDDFLPPLPPKY